MDCDDHIGLVKSDHNPHANTPNHSGISRLPVIASINVDGVCNHCFRVPDIHS
jgi:hypothetical protein